MKKIIPIITLLTIVNISSAQIHQKIEDFSVEFGRPPYEGFRPFVGHFLIDDLPEPLKPTQVSFTLEVTETLIRNAGDDWWIKLHYPNNAVHVFGDTLFLWQGPHKAGDIFMGNFEYTPLLSGKWGMTLYLYKTGDISSFPIESGISFEWRLDADGRLLYLGRIQGISKDSRSIRTNFFEDDSVLIRQNSDHLNSFGFEYNILFSPLPRINDTTKITYLLKANEYMKNGCDIIIYCFGMEVVSETKWLDYPITEGQTVEYTFKAMPKPVRNNHCISLHYEYDSDEDGIRHGYSIGCSFIFNRDGSLKYISQDGFDNMPTEIYPSNFPKASASRDNSAIILKVNEKKKIIR